MKQPDRQKDRKTDGQLKRQTSTQTNRQTDSLMYRLKRQSNPQTCCDNSQKNMLTKRETDRHTERTDRLTKEK